MRQTNRPPYRGRGISSNKTSRFLENTLEAVDDGWSSHIDDEDRFPRTEIHEDSARTVISWNDSPDIPFDRSINPYRGCEHGCPYCYARPSHAYLGLSPGSDFETKIFVKSEAPKLLAGELRKAGYRPAPIALGANTDPYQPVERKLKLTRGILEVLRDFSHPATIVTKSGLIERDIDILQPMAKAGLVHVMFSVTTLDGELARRLEPRAATPERRLKAMGALHAAGISVGVLFAPVIPALNDPEMEAVLERCKAEGAETAGYVMLRLPHEVKELFQEWLGENVPLKAKHVMSLVREVRGGKENSPEFGERMRGTGVYADVIALRFRLACERLGINKRRVALDCSKFAVPAQSGDQMSLW